MAININLLSSKILLTTCIKFVVGFNNGSILVRTFSTSTTKTSPKSLLALSINKKSSNNVIFFKSEPAIHLSLNPFKVLYKLNLPTFPVTESAVWVFTTISFKFVRKCEKTLFNMLCCKSFCSDK